MIRRHALLFLVILILGVQAAASHFLRRAPFLPSPPPLANLPLQLGSWQQIAVETVAPETLTMLGPDDYLAREYQLPGNPEPAELFVAYYKTQLQGKNSHDPKVCLPGAGWNPVESRVTRVTIPGSSFSFPANYYRIKKEERDEVVVYWFQTFNGVYTFEQQLRVHKVLDAILDNRTDMALVRIIVPVAESGSATNVSVANDRVMGLAQTVYTSMLPYFPRSGKSGS